MPRTIVTNQEHKQRSTTALEAELQRCVRILIEEYKPLKILLFGSLAEGRANEGSDIDLVVIKDTKKRFLDRIGEVLKLLCPREPLDILVYAPSEFEKLTRERPFFRDEVSGKGKVLYCHT